jgi:hypothetical protein
MKRGMHLLALLALGLGTACAGAGQGAATAQDAADDAPAADVKAPDPGIWSNPLGELGVETPIDGLEAALPFDAVVPANIGEPTATFVSDPLRAGLVAMQVGFVYDHPDYGQFIVVEGATGASQEELVEPAMATPGCHMVTTAAGSEVWECVPDDFFVATIRGDVDALVVENEFVSAITWLQPLTGASDDILKEYRNPMMEIEVMVPAGQLTRDQLVALANTV